MSHLQYFNYKGVGERNQKNFHYNQAVRIGDRIECSGQGGWDPKDGTIPSDLDLEIDQAFANVDLTVKTAGGKGWSQVYRVNSYHVILNEQTMKAMVRNLRQWLPDHQPIWTCVGVPNLAEEAMKVEIEVVAHDPDAGKAS